ncbi:MAG: DedA family protein [Burkholderiales bacterium]|nr:DedA family protein [Burkholderiales bacterium]
MLPSLQELIGSYGYLAVLVGTFFEGETILVLGGLAAHLGYLELPRVIATAFAGALAGDQLWFVVGRLYGRRLLARRARWIPRVQRIDRVLRRHEIPVLVGFRFVYGFRSLTPFVVGMGSISAIKFLILNAVGAALWSATVACAGFLFGRAVEAALGDLRRYELALIAFVALTGLGLWFAHRAIERRRRQAPGPTEPPG